MVVNQSIKNYNHKKIKFNAIKKFKFIKRLC